MRLALGLLLVVAAFALVGCGGGHKQVSTGNEARALPPANPVAVGKMVQGVGAAKDGQRDRAVSLLREAIGIDPNLWEARFNLGVVLAGAERDLRALTTDNGWRRSSRPRFRTSWSPSPRWSVVAASTGAPPTSSGTTCRATRRPSTRGHSSSPRSGTPVRSTRPSHRVKRSSCANPATRRPSPSSPCATSQKANATRPSFSPSRPSTRTRRAPSPTARWVSSSCRTATTPSRSNPSSKRRRKTPATPRPGSTWGASFSTRASTTRPRSNSAPSFRCSLERHRGPARPRLPHAPPTRPAAKSRAKLRGERKQILTKVVDRDPHNIAALYNLGVLYADFLKRPADATPMFQRFLADAPSDHPARADAEKYMSGATAAKPAAPNPTTPATKPAGKPPQGKGPGK